MADVIIQLPPLPVQLLPSVSAFAALRALPSMSLISGQDYAVDGSDAFGDGGGGLFVWAPSSMQVDDDATIVRPADLTPMQAGRWLLAGGKYFTESIAALEGQVATDIAVAVGTLEDDLSDEGGAGKVGFSHAETYSQGTIGGHAAARLCVTDAPWNALGDRTTNNAAKIQTAMDYGVAVNDQYPAAVEIPAGNFRITTSLQIDQQASIEGHGPSSLINCQGKSFPDPLFVNKNSTGLINGQFRNMGGYGGSHFLKLTASAENADIHLTNVVALLQTTAAIEANQLFQTAKVMDCTFGLAPYGVKVNSSGTNACYFHGVQWVEHSECSLYLRGSQALTVIGGRFEGGGQTGKNTIDLTLGGATLFQGVYFENTGEYLLKCRDMYSEVVFDTCWFTGTTAGTAPPVGGVRPYQWDCADNRIVFRNCRSVVPMFAPPNAVLEGDNFNIYPSKAVYWGNDFQGGVKAKSMPVPSGLVVDLLTFTRVSSGAADNAQAMGGTLTLTYVGIGPAPSGVSRTLVRQYQVLVYGLQVFAMQSETDQIGSDLGDMNGVTVTLADSTGEFSASTTNGSNTLTITALTKGRLSVGDLVSAAGVLGAGTSITAQLTGAAGGVGTYSMSAPSLATATPTVFSGRDTTLGLSATFAGFTPATENAGEFGWSFEWDRAEGPPAVAMTVTIP